MESNDLATTQGINWNTTLEEDQVGYNFKILRKSDSKVYQTSINSIEVDNTAPSVYFSYISENTPSNRANAVRTVNSNRHSFNLSSDELLANIIIVANYDEPVISQPVLTLNQQGALDVAVSMLPDSGTLPANVFYYAYKVNVQDAGNYIDGIAQVSLSDVRDRARGHLDYNSNSESEEILGHPNNEVDSSTVLFSIDTIAPTISSLEFSVTDDSIVAETSTLELQFSESLYAIEGDELITGVLTPGNYALSGSGSDGLVVESVTHDTSTGIYTLSLNGIVGEGTLKVTIFQENVVDFHNNPFGSPNSAVAVWPGPLIHLHEVVLSPGGRTRLLLRGGFPPYEQTIANVYSRIANYDSDGVTIHGGRQGQFFIDVMESRGQVRIIEAEVSANRNNSIDMAINAYRDEFDFKMVTFPFNLENWTGADLMDMLQDDFGTLGEDYVLYYVDGDQEYASMTEQTTEVGPGYGFWMASRKRHDLTMVEDGPLHEQVVAVDLHEGWNLVGNPFDIDLDVSQIYVSTGTTRYPISDVTQSETGNSVWYIDSSSSSYQSLDTIPPFTGVWLYVDNEAGAEVIFSRSPEDSNLEIYFPSKPNHQNKSLAPGIDLPPLRPVSFSDPGSTTRSTSTSSSVISDGGGGGGGCLLKH